LAKARQEKCIVLTHDLDFGELVAASGARLPSVIIFRLRNMKPAQVKQYLERVITQHQDELAQGAVISVTEGRFRVRLLPIETDG
jgi:predicted nuclease of predicted toxin-antitoxin system